MIEAQPFSQVNFKEDVGDNFFRWDRIGTAMSPGVSLFNHSCDPNCTQLYMDNHIVLVAAKFIPEVSF